MWRDAENLADDFAEAYRQGYIDRDNEIVLCKDCRHNPKYTNNYMYGICPCCCEDDYYSRTPDDDFYCGYGERKEE